MHGGSNGQCPCVLHIIRPEYVGPQAAREVVETWYRQNAEMGTGIFRFSDATRLPIERIVCEDVFSVKLDPTTVLRAFTLQYSIREPSIGEEELDFTNVALRQDDLEPLYRIKNKSGFNLDIEMYQWHIRLNLWSAIFSIFKDLIEHFEREGAYVRIRFTYCGKRNKYPVENLVKQHEPHEPVAWKQGVVEQFENVGFERPLR
jgi:hypothetical protein